MFPMTVTINNPAQFNAVMAALNFDDIKPSVDHPVEPTKTERPAKGKKPGAVPTAEAPPSTTTEVAKSSTAEQKPEALTQMTAGEAEKALHGHANNPADAPTYQATADAITKLARTKGRDAAVAVLTKFGAAKLPDVKPEDFAAVIAECETAGA